jgi:2'-hydroxyisoflavone reductase
MIVGPYDKTDRYTYWFLRASKGGKMLSLCERDERAQFIDARDLAIFCFHLLGEGMSGAYMATGPHYAMTWGDIFDEAALLTNTSYEIVRPPLDLLEEHGVERGTAFPGQIPSELDKPGFYAIDVSKAIDAGLHFRSLKETIEDTIEWRNTVADPLKVGLSAEKEAELLQIYLREEI